MQENDRSQGPVERRGLAAWSGARVAWISFAWVCFVLALTAARAFLTARAYHRAHPDEDYLVAVGTPGGGWSVFGPPLVLLVAWLVARRQR